MFGLESDRGIFAQLLKMPVRVIYFSENNHHAPVLQILSLSLTQQLYQTVFKVFCAGYMTMHLSYEVRFREM